MIARSAPSPSSPAPSARRYAALGPDRSARPSKRSNHAANAYLTVLSRTEDKRSSDSVRRVEYWFPQQAPPDERGGNRYVRPKATAPHLDSTILDILDPLRTLLVDSDNRTFHFDFQHFGVVPGGDVRQFARKNYLPTPPSRLSSVTTLSSPLIFSAMPSARSRSRTRPRAPTMRSVMPRDASSSCSRCSMRAPARSI